MADEARVVFRFEDGGSGTAPMGSAPRAPKATTVNGSTTDTEPVKEARKLRDVLKDAGKSTRDAFKSLRAGKYGEALTSARSAGSAAMEAAGGTRAGALIGRGASAATSAIGSGATKAASALAAIGGPAVVVGAALVAVGLGAKKASDALRKIGEEVGQFSGAVQAARGRNRALKTQQDVERAQRFGDRIARQEEVDGRLERAQTEFNDNITAMFAPLADLWTEAKDIGAATLESINDLVSLGSKEKEKSPFDVLKKTIEKFEKMPLPDSGWLRDRGLTTGREVMLPSAKFEGLPLENR